MFIYKDLDALAIPVFLYFLVIIVMCWQGISLYISKKGLAFKMIALSVMLFLISDSILAFDKFKIASKIAGLLVLVTYWMSISLLSNSTRAIEEGESI